MSVTWRGSLADAFSMAAAANRLVDDPLEIVSPELVLVDAALAAEVRRRLVVPEDTLTRLWASRPTETEGDLGGLTEASPEIPRPDLGRTSGSFSDVQSVEVVPREEFAEIEHGSRMYPTLPAPAPGHSFRGDATDAVLRRISQRLGLEVEPPKKPSRRVLSIVSSAAACCSLAMLAVDLRLGLWELPGWLH
jgi:hypothetical protein